MAQETRITPTKINLAKSTNYKLNIASIPETIFWLTTCNIPTFSANEVPIPNPIHGYRYLPTNTSSLAPMTVTFLVDEDYSNYMEVLNLMYKAVGPDVEKRYSEGEVMVSTGSLHILSNNKNVTDTVFTFHNLFPTILGELQMTNESPDPMITDLTMQYDYMTYQSGIPL